MSRTLPLPVEYLREIFEYRDGCLFYRVNRYGGQHQQIVKRAGERAGFDTDDGYRSVSIDRRRYKEHRIIWAVVFGEIPTGMEIDHIDRNGRNNRVENLRLASSEQNKWNSSAAGCWEHTPGVWRAAIKTGGKRRYLGLFKTRDAAAAAYEAAKAVHHGSFGARG